MTIASDISRVDLVGDGVNDTFVFTFEIYTKTDILVYVGGVLKDVDVHYTVPIAGIENPDGGNVVFTVGNKPGDGVTVSIILNLPLTQSIDYVEADKFPAETHERGLDRLVKIAQQHKEKLSRTPSVAISSALSDLTIPEAASRVIGWDALAEELTTYPITPVLDANWDSIQNYDNDLATAVATIGAGAKTLLIDVSTESVIANLEIPETLELYPIRTGLITVDNCILTINRLSSAVGAYKIFNCINGGTVVLKTKKACPEWWGNNTTPGTTDMAEAIQSAADSGPPEVAFYDVSYAIGTGIDFPPKVSPIGKNRVDTVIKAIAAIKMFQFDGSLHGDADGWDQVIENFLLDGDGVGTTGIFLKGTRHLKLRNTRITGCIDKGIEGVANGAIGINVCRFGPNLNIDLCDYGIHITDITYCWFDEVWVNNDTEQTKSLYLENFYGLNFNNCYFEGRGVQLVYQAAKGARDSAFNDCHWIESTETGLIIPQNAQSIEVNGGSFGPSEITVPNYGIDCDGINCILKPRNVSGTYGTIPILLDTNSIACIVDVLRLGASPGITDSGIRNLILRERGSEVAIPKEPSRYAEIPTLADDATPSILGSRYWLTGGTTTITDFDDGQQGFVITVIAEHSLDITDGTNIFLDGSANWSMTATDTLTLIQKADGKWYEIGRSDSGA